MTDENWTKIKNAWRKEQRNRFWPAVRWEQAETSSV
jgi:hypothetical protein